MEKIITSEKQNTIQNENFILQNRKILKLDGIVEVLTSSETGLYLKLKDTNLSILGENINIQKLDINTGTLEAEGKFNSIKYGTSKGFLKRIFK